MNKICTSIEQSKKLIELGINVETADMCYCPIMDIDSMNNIGFLEIPECYPFSEVKECKVQYLPAWSLSALLGLMPTDDKKDEYYVDTESHSDYYTVSYINCWDGRIHSEYSTESLIDATFEMIVWLKENKKI